MDDEETVGGELDDEIIATLTNRPLNIGDDPEKVVFARIICDEAQQLRNRNSAISVLTSRIRRQATHLVTATPTLNRISDIRGLLDQIAVTAKLPFYVDRGPLDPRPFLRDEYDPFDPHKMDPLASAYIEDYSLLNQAAADEDIQEVQEWVKRTGKKPWILLPAFFSKIDGGDKDDDVSGMIYREAIRCVQTRRTMRDPVIVSEPQEDGTTIEVSYFPGQNIPPNKVMMEELSFKGMTAKEDETTVATLVNTLCAQLNNSGGDPPNTVPDIQASDSGEVSDSGRMNMAINRQLSMLSFDLRTNDILCQEDALSASDKIRATITEEQERATASVESHLPTKAGSAKGKSQASKNEAPTLGVNQVNHLIAMDPDGGLTYTWLATEWKNARALPPIERSSMVYWGLSKSPVCTRLFQHIANDKKAGKRALIVVDNQWCQQ